MLLRFIAVPLFILALAIPKGAFATEPCYDVTGNGVVNMTDLVGVILAYGHYDEPGLDVDHSGKVTIRDVLLVYDHLGQVC